MIKPQISKEYAMSLVIGRPDLSILENEFEIGDKFYEPQYSITRIDCNEGTIGYDGQQSLLEEGGLNGPQAEIRFRESESQIKQEQAMMQGVLI